jgi:hypothetical protein
MTDLSDATELYIKAVNGLQSGKIALSMPLEEIVLRSCGEKFAYIDNRNEAKSLGYDLWTNVDPEAIIEQKLNKNILYSRSQRFPDFLFKIKRIGNMYSRGSLLE